MGLLVIGGPTASGKSALALQLAVRLNGEIVSADSVQVYQGLDIASAKPSHADRSLVKHHLIDVLSPRHSMDAGCFAVMAERAIAGIAGRGKNIVLVGGTGLYLRALLYGLAEVPPVSRELREQLRQELEAEGLEFLYRQLTSLDPVSAGRIHFADRQRILRALEVVRQTGQPLSRYQERHDKRPRHRHLLWAIERPRAELRQLIEQRARRMWGEGLLGEVEGLLARGLPPRARSLQSLGYRQALAVLQGRMNETDALAEMVRLTQAYAKRQVTWFRNMDGVQWIGPELSGRVLEESRRFLENL